MLKFNNRILARPLETFDSSEIDQRTQKFRELSWCCFLSVLTETPPLNTPLRIQLAAIARGSFDYADENN